MHLKEFVFYLQYRHGKLLGGSTPDGITNTFTRNYSKLHKCYFTCIKRVNSEGITERIITNRFDPNVALSKAR